MKNKKNFLLIISLLLVVSCFIAPANAKKLGTGDEAKVSAPTAGVGGATGQTLRALENMDVIMCKTSECKLLKDEIVSLNQKIEQSETSLSDMIKKEKLKKYKEIGKEKLLNSLKKEIEKLSNSINKTPKSNLPLKPNKKRVAFVEQREQKINEFIDVVTELAPEWDNISSMLKKRVELNDQLIKEVEDMKNINQDQTDVEPVQSGCLNDGDLIAWGIPSVPRIPTPRPKSNTSSSSSSKSAEPKPVTDEGYKALRSVEVESGKVTDSEKDQFISELDSRVGSN